MTHAQTLSFSRSTQRLGPWSRLARDPVQAWIATAVAFLIPITSWGLFGIATLNPGVLLALAVVPLWFTSASEYRGARLLQWLLVASALVGPLLAYASSASHDVDVSRAVGLPATMLFSALTIGVLLWARSVTNLARVALAYGAGALLDAVLRASDWGELGWKYGYAWPCAVILLALVIGRRREPWLAVIAFVALSLVSVPGGYRSLIAFCLVAVCLYLFINGIRFLSPVKRAVSFTIAAVIVPIAAYVGMSWLLLSGALGQVSKERTETQIAESGSILAGGRQEWAAAVGLIRDNFFGFGPGVIPTAEDIEKGKDGLRLIGVDTGSYHVNEYIFGQQFRFHSIAADLWGSFGPIGLVLAAALLFLVIQFVFASGFRASVTALQVLMFVWSAWDILFSPVDSNWRFLLFAVSLLLMPKQPKPELDRLPAFNLRKKSNE